MRNTHIGIIGGGQLGMLLVQAAIPFPCRTSVYDPNPNCSARHFTDEFTQGSFDDFEAILEFGRNCDAVIFEIEAVNVEALLELQKQGVRVLSSPQSLKWIQNKGTQRQTLSEAGFPCPSFAHVSAQDVHKFEGELPMVQKWNTGGYDGQGVNIIRTAEELTNAKATDSTFEELVDIDKELSCLFARSESGEIAIYPAIEMVFDPKLNLIDHLLTPAQINDSTEQEMQKITRELASKLELIGVYAIEFFLTKDGRLLINEISPRVHNSGHHTVSANVCSQYEQQIRIALKLPLGSTEKLHDCLLANLIADNSTGTTEYKGIEEAYKLPKTQFFFYGKDSVRPGRKMGHVLIHVDDLDSAQKTLQTLRKTLTITSND